LIVRWQQIIYPAFEDARASIDEENSDHLNAVLSQGGVRAIQDRVDAAGLKKIEGTVKQLAAALIKSAKRYPGGSLIIDASRSTPRSTRSVRCIALWTVKPGFAGEVWFGRFHGGSRWFRGRGVREVVPGVCGVREVPGFAWGSRRFRGGRGCSTRFRGCAGFARVP
jgi:hypothetical protein